MGWTISFFTLYIVRKETLSQVTQQKTEKGTPLRRFIVVKVQWGGPYHFSLYILCERIPYRKLQNTKIAKGVYLRINAFT